MIRRLAVAAIAAAALLLQAGANVRAAEPPATIRVGATGNDTAAEVYYADELGLFKKRGLTVEIQNLRNGAAEAAAVAGGSLDIGEQNVISMSTAHLHGLPFKMIAPAGEYVSSASTTSLAVGKNSSIKTGRDLESKTVAVNALGDLTNIGAVAWIDKHGGDATKAKFIEIPAAEIGAALSRGTVDAGVIPEPSLTMAEGSEVKVIAQPYDAIADRFLINGWFARDDWIKKNGSAAKRFADAILEAARWANAHRAESAKILEKHSRADAAVVGRMRRATYGERFDPKSLQAVIDTAVRFKFLKQSFPAQDLIDANL